MIALDHIVYATLDFEKSLDDIEKATGVRPIIGGKHLNQGTKNALLNLGNQTYFEILAIDKSNTTIHAYRWMGIDLINKDRATRLAFKSNDIKTKAEILKQINPQHGQLIMGERQLPDQSFLKWQMTLPLAKPAIDLIPFFINWGSGNHPCDKLEATLKLENLKLCDPNAKMLNEDFKRLGISETVIVDAQSSISGTISGPKGSFNF